MPGSSPLARGLQRRGLLGRSRGRIIPARAGFTARGGQYVTSPGDHPRSRGVYVTGTLAPALVDGSSPLARGLPDGAHFGVPFFGIIPARAGFTPGGHTREGQGADHPRSRGVYVTVAASYLIRHGSSPLARGLQRIGPVDAVGRRIIPARAGFTLRPPTLGTSARDHPRSRGVYLPHPRHR